MRKLKRHMFVVILIFAFVIVSAAQGTTYYVSASNGNDSNNGISRTSAFKTISKAKDIMTAGDKVIVLAGNYNERVMIYTSGASGSPIVYEAEGRVVMKGFTVYANYVHIDGFEITNNDNHWRESIGVFVQGKYCEVRNNYIHNVNLQGIRILGQTPDSPDTKGCVLKNNRIYKATLAGIEISGQSHLVQGNDISRTLQNGTSDADGMRFQGSGHVIRKNSIHDIRLSDPENVDPHIDCLQTWGPAYNILIEQNYFENMNDNMQGFMMEEVNSPVQDITIKNNIIKAFRFMNLWSCDNSIIVNNTLKSELNYSGASGYGIELHNSPNSKVQNNLMIDVGRHRFAYVAIDGTSSQGLVIGYNCIYMTDGQAPVGSAYSHDLWQVDPKVVGISSNDFHLTSNSPLINSGTAISGVTNDYEGNSRPYASSFDIGVYEYIGAPPAMVTPPLNVQVIFFP